MIGISKNTSLLILAAIVSEALRRRGITAVLSGGSVVSIYSTNRYQSYDLDFITTGQMRIVAEALRDLGFERKVGRHFVHPSNPFLIEFPGGPLAIGDHPVRN